MPPPRPLLGCDREPSGHGGSIAPRADWALHQAAVAVRVVIVFVLENVIVVANVIVAALGNGNAPVEVIETVNKGATIGDAGR